MVEGEVGEICVKGKNIFSRYYGKNEEIFNNGWFRTGDLAYKDDTGNYWFADRIKNVIIISKWTEALKRFTPNKGSFSINGTNLSLFKAPKESKKETRAILTSNPCPDLVSSNCVNPPTKL